MIKKIISIIPIAFLGLACDQANLLDRDTVKEDIEIYQPKSIGDCQSLKQEIEQRSQMRSNSEQNTYTDGAPVPAQGSVAHKNEQEVGVQEEDIYQVSEDHVFISHPGKIQAIDIESKEVIDTYNFDNPVTASLFLEGDRLVGTFTKGNQYHIETYSFIDNKIEREFEFVINGSLLGVRRIGKKMYVVTNKTILPTDAPITDVGTSCERLYQWTRGSYDTQVVQVYEVDLNNSSEIQTLALLDGGNMVYMSPTSLYITLHANNPWAFDRNFIQRGSGVVKINLSDLSSPKFKLGFIPGRIKDRWALKEKVQDSGEYLFAATTLSGEMNSDRAGGTSENFLNVFKDEGEALSPVASVGPFAPREDIRAVRYVDNTAYIVTFEKTDPLYAIDISHPHAPEILGELKIPGFSTQLYPYAEGKLLGVGFDAVDMGSYSLFQGIQLSLFDVTRQTQLQRTAVRVLGSRGSFSEAQFNGLAINHIRSHDYVAIPTVELSPLSEPHNSSSILPQNGQRTFSGLKIFDLKDLSMISSITHSEWVPKPCQNKTLWWWESPVRSYDIRRSFAIKDELWSLSPVALTVHDLNDFSSKEQIIFEDSETKSCGNTYPPVFD